MSISVLWFVFFFFQAEDGIRDGRVTGVQTCALPISAALSECNASTIARAPSRATLTARCKKSNQRAHTNTHTHIHAHTHTRSEERRVGKECRTRRTT